MFGEDMQSDQLHVPALFQFHFIVNGNRLSPEPACRNLHFSVVTRGILHLPLDMAYLFEISQVFLTDPFLSGVIGVFLHVRYIPHQNSQKLF